MTDANPSNPSSDPAPSGGLPSPAGGSAGSDRERALIAGALKQASPRPGSASFPLRPREIDKAAIPGYEIIREIHRGGQGVVYQAIQKSTQRKVAIKVVHGGPFAGPRERARVEREVRVLAGLDHPNIVKVHDSGEIPGIKPAPGDPAAGSRGGGGSGGGGGAFYYVMDYVSGHSLDAIITKDPKPVEDILKLFIEICEAVSAAHLKGVIHRDLKPSNIRVDTSGKPHVLDFGLAKLSIPDETDDDKPRVMTMTGQFIGSLPWASPEQAAGTPGAIDIRTDVYSLGVMLYQLLTGKFPYQVVGQMRDVLDNILKAEPAKPSTIRRQVNDEVETIVLKCLAKEPERRYQSAGELARDLRRYLAGEPIEAKRDSGWYMVTKALRRHRSATIVAAGFLGLILVFAAVMSAMWTRERNLRELAENRRQEVIAESAAKDAARAQAEANFQTVREMAHAFMFDFSDGIADLRGGTLVREKLLKTAQAALKKLADAAEAQTSAGPPGTASANPALLRELADAHDRVGDIEGGLYLPRAGQTAQGAEHYAAARTIRERLLAAAPQSAAAMLDLAESQRRTARTLQRQRKFAVARTEFAAALTTLDHARAAAGADPTISPLVARRTGEAATGLANLLVTMSAETAANLDDAARLIAEAESLYLQAESGARDRLRADAGDARAATMLGELIDARARAATTLGRAHADAAWKAADAGNTAEALRLLETATLRFVAARMLAESAAAEFERQSAARPQDAALRRNLLIATYNIGDARMREGDVPSRAATKNIMPKSEADPPSQAAYAAAIAAFDRAQRIAEELVSADQGNLEARRDLVLVLNKLGNVVRDQGDLARASSIFQRSLDLREDLWRTDPMQQHRLDLAVGLYKLAEVCLMRARSVPATGDGTESRRAYATTARTLYSRSLEAYTELKTAGVAIRDADIERVKRELAAATGLEQ